MFYVITMSYYKVVFTGILIKGNNAGTRGYFNVCIESKPSEGIGDVLNRVQEETVLSDIFEPGYTYTIMEITREEVIGACPESEKLLS